MVMDCQFTIFASIFSTVCAFDFHFESSLSLGLVIYIFCNNNKYQANRECANRECANRNVQIGMYEQEGGVIFVFEYLNCQQVLSYQQHRMGGLIGKNNQKELEELKEKATPEEIKQLVNKKIKKHLKHKPEDQKKYLRIFQQSFDKPSIDRALGCIFGSLIGDALGAYCQFQTKITPSTLEQAIIMPGGGVFNLAIGQFTDDNQLAYHLLKGLQVIYDPLKSISEQKYSILNQIALQYLKWIRSGPFDLGNTCRHGLQILRNYQTQIKQMKNNKQSINVWPQIYSKIIQINQYSQSNGSLMRIAPMAMFLSLLNENTINNQQFITNQIKLLHPNEVLQKVGISWVMMLIRLINRKTSEPKQFQQILNQVKQLASVEIKDWFDQTEQYMPAVSNMGWAKIAFSYGIKNMNKFSRSQLDKNNQFDSLLYIEEIQKIISQAGDTDTNAAIVGGLLGAVIGFKQLPIFYLEKIFQLRFQEKQKNKKNSTNRDRCYEPINVLCVALSLIDKCGKHMEK